MTALGQEVATKLNREVAEIEAVLTKHQVDLTAATPAPAHLVVQRLYFRGTKTLTGVTPDGETVDKDETYEVPFEFEWIVEPGLHGIGSDRNLRGKSSVIELLMWVLRGRQSLRSDVLNWIDHVEGDFQIDATAFHVSIDLNENVPSGELVRTASSGLKSTLGKFSDAEEFEALMNSTMMGQLNLPPISIATEGRRNDHTWPTYASALVINGSTLENLVGEHKYGLPSKLLQMFIGTDWSAVRAQAGSALKVAEFELAQRLQVAEQQNAQLEAAHAAALEVVTVVQQRLAETPAASVTADALDTALTRLTDLDSASADLQQRLVAARQNETDALAHLGDAEHAAHAVREDALATSFFHKMRPSVCPRCEAPVTDDRLQAEADGSSCSVCTHDISTDDDGGDAQELGHEDVDDEQAEVDELDALRQVADQATGHRHAIETEFAAASADRDQQASVVSASRNEAALAAERHQIELELARAEGAAAALEPAPVEAAPDAAELATLQSEVEVLKAAEKIVSGWVTDAQSEPLDELSADITRLARSFGMANLSEVHLDGATRMKVHTGGAQENYGDVERGEQLRLKVATAIALIRRSRSSGVGRHPGFLVVDSLGAEEIPDQDLRAMLSALREVADELGIQIFIATRNTPLLEETIQDDRCRLGRDNGFVW